jgi:hypothetical protein
VEKCRIELVVALSRRPLALASGPVHGLAISDRPELLSLRLVPEN